jgi:photosystem II stability/assembly factor-like uncharacterized protein
MHRRRLESGRSVPTSLGAWAAALVVAFVLGAPAASSAPSAGGVAAGSFVLVSASFVSTNEGFALGAAPCARTTCAQLVKTTDSGRHWQVAAAPPAPIASLGSSSASVPADAISKILFTKAQGFAYGPGLWMTTTTADPLHWVLLHPGGPVRALAVNAGVLWAVVASCWIQDPNCVTPALRLERALVGTDTWHVVGGIAGYNSSELVFDGDSAWVAMWPRRFPSPVSIWRTTNAGNTWARLPDPCYQPSQAIDLAGLASPGGSALFELCAGNPGAGQEAKSVLWSSNGGISTRRVGEAPLPGLVDAFAAPSRLELVLAASSGAGFLYRSLDAGAHWTATTLDDGGAGLSDLAFVNSSFGIVLDGGPLLHALVDHLLVTRDGGRSWSPITIAVPTVPSPPARFGSNAVWPQATFEGQMGVFKTCTGPAFTTRAEVQACAARYMAAHGASPAAVAFFEATGSYLIRFVATGRVDLGYTLSELPMDCGCFGWLILNGRPLEQHPPWPSITTPAYASLERAFRVSAAYGTHFYSLFLFVPPDLEEARTLPGGSDELWLQFPINNICDACTTPYRARALYRFSATGTLSQVVGLGPCRAKSQAGAVPTKVSVPEPACPPVIATP